MLYPRPSAYSKSVIAIVGAALVGCGDPTILMRPQLHPNSARSLISSVNGSTISISDDDGTSYTLDVDAREIRVSTGVVINLRQEDLAMYASGFMDIVIGDSLSNQINTLPPPEGEGHGGPCGWNPCDSRPAPSIQISGVATPSVQTSVPPFGARAGLTVPVLNPGSGLQDIIVDAGPFSCAEIAENIMVSHYVYRGSRPTLFGVFRSGVAAAAPFVTGIEAISWMIAVGADINTAMIVNAGDRLTLQINVAMYRMSYCSETYHTAGPLPSFSLGGGLTYACRSVYKMSCTRFRGHVI